MGLRPEDNYPANRLARGPIPDSGAHMSFLQRLTRTYLAAFLALLMLAALLGGASALTTGMAGSAVVGIKDSFFVVFLGTLLFGAAPALIIGVPSYAWLWHKSKASWKTALSLGAALGVPWLLADLALGALAMAAGAAVALATHAICRGGTYHPLARQTRDDAAATQRQA